MLGESSCHACLVSQHGSLGRTADNIEVIFQHVTFLVLSFYSVIPRRLCHAHTVRHAGGLDKMQELEDAFIRDAEGTQEKQTSFISLEKGKVTEGQEVFGVMSASLLH